MFSKIALGSTSAIKLRAVHGALAKLGIMSEVVGCEAPSGVSNQPCGTDEMQRGALNRALRAMSQHLDADLWVGMENGLVRRGGIWFDPVCVYIIEKQTGVGYLSFGAHFPIPDWMAELALKPNADLGIVTQQLYRAEGFTTSEKDPMQWLSGGRLERETLLTEAVRCAFLPIICRDRYAEPDPDDDFWWQGVGR